MKKIKLELDQDIAKDLLDFIYSASENIAAGAPMIEPNENMCNNIACVIEWLQNQLGEKSDYEIYQELKNKKQEPQIREGEEKIFHRRLAPTQTTMKSEWNKEVGVLWSREVDSRYVTIPVHVKVTK